MRKQVISLALALLYFSVSFLFAVPHAHDPTKGLPHHCLACAWHFESTADAPVNPVLIVAPHVVVAPERHVAFRLFSSVPIVHCDRGPPLAS